MMNRNLRQIMLAGSLCIVACGTGKGGSCPTDTNNATFTGPLVVNVPSNPTLSSSDSTTVTIDGFQPSVQQSSAYCDSPQRYCGPQTFPVVLGPSCSIKFNVVSVSYDSRSCEFQTASANVAGAQPCSLETSGGTLSMTVDSGNLSATGLSSTQLTLGGKLTDGSGSASLMLQGS